MKHKACASIKETLSISSGSPFSKSYIEENILSDSFVKSLDTYISDLKKVNEPESLTNVSEKLYTLIEDILETIINGKFKNSKSILIIVLSLCNEFDSLSTEQIINLCDTCLDLIRNSHRANDNDIEITNSCVEQIWKTFIPNILLILERKTHFEHCGSRVTGKEYKTHVINALCSVKQSPQILISLTCMWIDITLTEEEHVKVVKSLCNALTKIQIKPEHIPPFIHQLLLLTKDKNSILVILKLRDFLVENLYNKLSKSKDEEVEIESSYVTDLIEAESMIIFHLEESAKYSRSLVTDLIKLIKSIQSLPEKCLDPFILALLLSLSNISMYETEILKLVKSIVINCFIEIECRSKSAWIRKQEVELCDVEIVFKTLIESSVSNKEKVLKGLVNISFTLLCTNVTPKLSQNIVEKIRRSGRYMIIMLIKKHRQVSQSILHRLCQYMYNCDLNYQYTDTLYQICSMCTFSALEQVNILNELITSMSRLPYQIIKRIIISVLPLVKLNSKFREVLLLSLRKMLFSNNVFVKQTAVFGFLHLLNQLRLRQFTSYSQNSMNQFSGPSLFTQMIMEVHSSQSQQAVGTQVNSNKNEAICLEVIGILRRCLSQPCIVRESLYKGFIDCLNVNTELSSSIMDLLLEHFKQYYVIDPSVASPLNMDRIVQLADNGEYVLQEPICEQVLVLGQVVTNAKVNSLEHDVTLFTNIEVITNKLESLVERFCRCDEDSFKLNDETKEISYKREVLVQVLGTYEALMTYKLYSLNINSSNDAGAVILNLFRHYNMFIDYINTKSKTKSNAKKSDDKDKATQKVTQTQATKNNKNSEDKQNLNIKLPFTILDFKILFRYLQILFLDNLDDIPGECLEELKSKRLFYHYVLNTTQFVMQSYDLNTERKNNELYRDICQLSKLIFENTLVKYKEIKEFDCKVSVQCLTMFYTMINIILTHYDNKLGDFLYIVTNKKVENGLHKQILCVLKVYHKLITDYLELLDGMENETNNDEYNEVCETLEILMNTLGKLTSKLENNYLQNIKEWLIDICETTKIKHKSISKQIVSLMLTLSLQQCEDVSILNNITVHLSNIYGVITEDNKDKDSKINQELCIVNNNTKNIILQLICDFINKIITNIEWSIIRLKSHYNILQLYKKEDHHEIIEKEKHMVQYTTSICIIIKNIINIDLPVESTQSSLKLIIKLYNMLNNIIKYYFKNTITNYKNTKFNCLVSLVGVQLSKQVADLLYNIEDSEGKNEKFVNLLLPRIILEQENFNKLILMLSKKFKDTSLSNNIKLIDTRDYKLNIKRIQSKLHDAEGDDGEVSFDPTSVEDPTTTIEDEPESKRSRLDSSATTSNMSSVF